eukprot:6172553-Pleurochrysis_carterae.AAC.3
MGEHNLPLSAAWWRQLGRRRKPWRRWETNSRLSKRPRQGQRPTAACRPDRFKLECILEVSRLVGGVKDPRRGGSLVSATVLGYARDGGMV